MEKIQSFQITDMTIAGFKSYVEPTNLVFGNPTVITGGNGRARGGSTGMGLYLCKKLAGFLELGLEIASEEGRGTVVTLTFPAREAL